MNQSTHFLHCRMRQCLGFLMAIVSCICAAASPDDCIEDGGATVCGSPQVGAWSYRMCDEAGNMVARYRAWCIASGGTWHGVYASQECTGATPHQESNLYPRAQAFSMILHPFQACTGGDTGWGSSVSSRLCWSGSPTYNHGVLVEDHRTLTFNCGETIRVKRDRGLVCPPGTQSRFVGSRKVCVHPVDDSCPVGNPIKAASGRKIQTEEDAVFESFPIRRHYASTGSAFQWNAGSGPVSIDSVWRSSLDLRLQPVSGSPHTTAAVSYPDGTIQYFRSDGTAVLPANDGAARLQSLADRHVLVSQRRYYTFNLSGLLIEIRDAAGLRLTLRYADGTQGAGGQTAVDLTGSRVPAAVPANHLIEVISSSGRRLQMDRDVAGRLVLLKLPGSVSPIRFDYGSAEHLSRVFYEDGSVKEYAYNEPAHTTGASLPDALTGISVSSSTGAMVRYATFKYAANGMAIATEHAGGADRYTLDLVGPGTKTTVTDPLRSSRVLDFTKVKGVVKVASQSQGAGAGCLPSVSRQQFDSEGNLNVRDDFNGHRTCHAHDPLRRLETQRVEGLRSTQACPPMLVSGAALPEGARKISTQWHPTWPEKTGEASPARLTIWVFNGQPDPQANNQIARCAPDEATGPDGLPLPLLCSKTEWSTSDPSGAQGFGAGASADQPSPHRRSWRWTYDASGRVLSETDPLLRVSYRSYYESANADHGRGDLYRMADAMGHTTQFLRYDAAGQVLDALDPNGVGTSYRYDLRRRLTAVSVAGQETTLTYAPEGTLKQITMPDGTWLSYEYDAAQRLRTVTDQNGNRIQYELDAAGNRTGESFFDPQGSLRRQLTRKMDPLGRVEQVTGRE